MQGIIYYKKRPKHCHDLSCFEPLLEIVLELVNPKKDDTKQSLHKGRAIRDRLPAPNRQARRSRILRR